MSPPSIPRTPWSGAEGAEAKVEAIEFLGVPAVRKVRPAKTYRPADLDLRLRTGRLRTEVRLLREARRAGVRTPIVLDVDESELVLVLERLPGTPLTEHLSAPEVPAEERERLVGLWGELLGRLHQAGMSHGDLTASNVLWDGHRLSLLDLSLGSKDPSLEERGIDLHLVEEDLNTLTPDAARLFRVFVDRYARAYRSSPEVLERVREIRGRIRYA
jgi:Kae1-associated kinase Bud32